MIPKYILRAKQSEKIEYLNRLTPNSLIDIYTVVPDQINGKTFALAKINKDYKVSEYYTHTPVTHFTSLKEFAWFLFGMQEQVRFIKSNNIKL